MEEFIDVLKNNPDGAYDYISNNYGSISKDELVSITKELLYSINVNVPREQDKILEYAADELENWYGYTDEDEQEQGQGR